MIRRNTCTLLTCLNMALNDVQRNLSVSLSPAMARAKDCGDRIRIGNSCYNYPYISSLHGTSPTLMICCHCNGRHSVSGLRLSSYQIPN